MNLFHSHSHCIWLTIILSVINIFSLISLISLLPNFLSLSQGASSPWNIGAAYRVPDSNINLSCTYQQGRASIQVLTFMFILQSNWKEFFFLVLQEFFLFHEISNLFVLFILFRWSINWQLKSLREFSAFTSHYYLFFCSSILYFYQVNCVPDESAAMLGPNGKYALTLVT